MAFTEFTLEGFWLTMIFLRPVHLQDPRNASIVFLGNECLIFTCIYISEPDFRIKPGSSRSKYTSTWRASSSSRSSLMSRRMPMR